MRSQPVSALLLLLLGLLAAPAGCQEDGAGDEGDELADQDIEEESLTAEQLRGLHGRFDQNGDGRVSLQEVLEYSQVVGRAIALRDIGSILAEIDTSKDGKLSLEEHLNDIHGQGDDEEMHESEQRKSVETAKFKAADKNNDQFLDEHEVAALFYPETHDDVLHVSVQETMRQKDVNSDGRLAQHEFWDAEGMEGKEDGLSEDEHADFKKLDVDGDGLLDIHELKSWESGRYHTEEAVRKLFEMADKDGDMHLTADELVAARQQITSSDAQYHLIEWAEHHEL